ncbi:MAG: polyprenyl synthetase family protein [bacterium]|nr:polyprenyl synthetase family protein [bacterium]
MFYKHNLKNLGVKYSFPELLNSRDLKGWCENVSKPDPDVLHTLGSVNFRKLNRDTNDFMRDRSQAVNGLFSQEIDVFLKEEKYNNADTKYFIDFLKAHFSQERHVRVLLVQLIGRMLLDAQNSPKGLTDDLKTRKIINQTQFETWGKTVDYLSLATEVLNAASYTADDAFDKTDSRYGVVTPQKTHGPFAGPIGADILLHYLGNYVFYKTIRIHEKGVEEAYLTGSGKISVNDDPYSLKWEDKETKTYVYINPEQYMDVWEVWTWAWYMINSGQIRDLYEFNISDIGTFNVASYVNRAYRLSGGFIECMAHLSSAFTGCGYWAGRQNIGKWAAIYGTIVQVRNDFYDYVTYTVEGSAHKLIKDTHEDVALGRVTLPMGFAYQKANASEKKEIMDTARFIADQKENGKEIDLKYKIKLNGLITKNGGFIASKKLVYNLVSWALSELLVLKDDFKDSNYYWELVAWTIASLNIANLMPEAEESQEKVVKDIFDLQEVYTYLK